MGHDCFPHMKRRFIPFIFSRKKSCLLLTLIFVLNNEYINVFAKEVDRASLNFLMRVQRYVYRYPKQESNSILKVRYVNI